MHRDERQHKPENTIMENNDEHEGRNSGCNTASCYAVDNLKQAWEDFVKVFNKEAPKIQKKAEDIHPNGLWAVRIDDHDRTLLVQDIHPVATHPNLRLEDLA